MEAAQVSIGQREDKEGVYTCTVEYYSAMKKNGLLPFSRTGLDLEGMMLSETSHREKDKHCVISLTRASYKS